MDSIRQRLDNSRLALFCDKTHVEDYGRDCDTYFDHSREYYLRSPTIFEYIIDYYIRFLANTCNCSGRMLSSQRTTQFWWNEGKAHGFSHFTNEQVYLESSCPPHYLKAFALENFKTLDLLQVPRYCLCFCYLCSTFTCRPYSKLNAGISTSKWRDGTQLVYSDAGSFAMVVMRVMRLARVARIFKLARYSIGLRAFGETMKKSAAELSMLGMFLLTGIMLFSTAIYFFEKDEVNSKFYSIPSAWWWCVATMTTVGYGDLCQSLQAARW
uniref:Ion transport domain-containing protein n=1 Tax=Ditylenchus dipsaci TaxID=166011 RepID=A0A915DIF6_9BILA